MSDEHDSWFKNAFGLDVGEAVGRIKEEVSGAVDQATTAVSHAAQSVQTTVEGAANAVSGAVKKVAAVAGSVDVRNAAPSQTGGGGGSFPLRGSVGRGGKNAAGDVRAVQGALGLNPDGQCGAQTIAAIESFQRNMGVPKPDGRVDAGGRTERELSGGGQRRAAATESPAASTSAPPRVATPPEEDPGLFGRVQGAINDVESSVQGTLQSAQNSAFEAAGISPEAAQLIREGEQAIADFDRGRNEGRASGSMGLIDMLPPVALAKAAIRVGSADDPLRRKPRRSRARRRPPPLRSAGSRRIRSASRPTREKAWARPRFRRTGKDEGRSSSVASSGKATSWRRRSWPAVLPQAWKRVRREARPPASKPVQRAASAASREVRRPASRKAASW